MNRESKIENILKLIKGQIKPDDLQPKRLCMAIGYREHPIFTINEKEVSEEEYWKWAKTDPDDYGTGLFNITYGDRDMSEGGSHA